MFTYRAGIWLHVHAPLGWVEVERGESTFAAEYLELINILISAVVPRSRKALRVLVGQNRPICLHRGQACEILK